MTPAARFDLAGKTALVTGGAGILGRHFCRALLEAGANVAVLDLDRTAVDAFAGELGGGARVLALAGSVADAASVAACVARTVDRFGRVDVLMNNAASKGTSLEKFLAPFEDYDPATWREVMDVNVTGMFLMAQAVGRHMRARGGGSIIQTASIYGVVAPDQRIYQGSHYMGREISSPAVYAASKAAVVGLTRYLAAYWGGSGIRVNAISPGGIESGQNETFQRAYGARVPMGRMGDAEELIGAVLWLASDASSYVTGQNLVIDGGLSAW